MVGMGVGVAVGVAVGVLVGVAVGVAVGVLVGVAVGVAVGVLVGVAVLVGTAVLVGVAVAVGKGVALGAGVVVGADAGAQADNIKLTRKNIVHERFIVRVLLSAVKSPNGPRFSRAAKRSGAASGASAGWAALKNQDFAITYRIQHNVVSPAINSLSTLKPSSW